MCSQERVRQNYCPSLGEELFQECEEHLAHSYLAMLNMIVQVNITFYGECTKRSSTKGLSSDATFLQATFGMCK